MPASGRQACRARIPPSGGEVAARSPQPILPSVLQPDRLVKMRSDPLCDWMPAICSSQTAKGNSWPLIAHPAVGQASACVKSRFHWRLRFATARFGKKKGLFRRDVSRLLAKQCCAEDQGAAKSTVAPAEPASAGERDSKASGKIAELRRSPNAVEIWTRTCYGPPLLQRCRIMFNCPS